MSLAPFITQLLSFFITPIITRIFTPEAFGLYAIYGSILGPIGVFSNMGYSSAIVLPEKDSDAINLFYLCILLTFITALSSFFIYFATDLAIFSKFNTSELSSYFWLIPVGLITNGIYMSLRYWNIRKKRFGYISSAKIFRFISNNGTILLLGFSGFTSGVILILSGLVGSVVSPAILSKSLVKKLIHQIHDHVSLSNLKNIAIRYSKFPKVIVANDLISRISSQTPIYLFSIYFSQSIIGFYAIGMRLITIPMNLIGNAIGEVFFQEAAKNKNEIPFLLEKVVKSLALIAVPIYCFIGFLGEDLFTIVFGNSWSQAGLFAQILSVYMLSQFVTIPTSYLILVHEKQEYSIILNIATMIATGTSLVIGGKLGNINLSLILMSSTNSLIYLVYGIGFMKYAGLSIYKILKIFITMFILCIPLVICLYSIKIVFIELQLQVVVYGTISFIIIYILILSSIPDSRKIIFLLWKRLKSNGKQNK